MQRLENVHKDLLTVKIVIVGAPKVGKSSLLRKWKFNYFPQFYKPTIGLDHFDQLINISGNFPVYLSLDEVAGTQYPLPLNTSQKLHVEAKPIDGEIKEAINLNRIYFRKAKIFFIIISTETPEEHRIAQINYWRAEIKRNMDDGDNYKIIVIENQFWHGMRLSEQHIAENIRKDEHYITLSIREEEITPLENIVKKILPEVIEETPQKPPLAGIIKLDDKQAVRVLSFVERIIKYGANHNMRKPFEVGLFCIGGKNYKYSSLNRANISQEQTVRMPTNVVRLLNSITGLRQNISNQENVDIPTNAKKMLVDLYEKSINISKSKKPISRWRSTQIFYSKILPRYIFKSVQPETLVLHTKIDNLSQERAKEILGELKIKLLTGNNKSAQHVNNPYGVCFFGGDTYKHGEEKIKLPHHVALLVTKIDKYIKLNSAENANQILSEVYQDIIQAQLTPNVYRKPTTQKFYDEDMPKFINNCIANIVLELSPAAAWPNQLK